MERKGIAPREMMDQPGDPDVAAEPGAEHRPRHN